MYPHNFTEQAKQWLTAADHPGITKIRTCAEAGWWEHPVGLVLDLSDGWRFILQCIGTAPTPSGDADRDPDDTPPARFDGEWNDRDDYRQARRRFEVESWAGTKTRRPQATVESLLAVVVEAAKRADHPKVVSVEIPDDRPVIKVTFTDGSAVYGLPVGYLTPGAAELAHKPQDVPEGWR